MENVSVLERTSIDLQPQQAALIEAEDVSLQSVEACAGAAIAFVEFVRKMELSVVHPQVRHVIKEIPGIISKGTEMATALSDCHRQMQKLTDARPAGEILLSGGRAKPQ